MQTLNTASRNQQVAIVEGNKLHNTKYHKVEYFSERKYNNGQIEYGNENINATTGMEDDSWNMYLLKSSNISEFELGKIWMY